jgi:hypothetical protein
MTPDEFKEAMAKIAASDDAQLAHVEADGLMCKLLTELGFGAGVDVFEEMPKWYA